MKLETWGLGLALTVLGAGSALATTFDDLTEWEARLEKLEADFQQANKDRSQAYRAAETDEARMQALSKNPWTPLEPVARQLAEDAAGTEVAAEAWGMVFNNFDERGGDQDDHWDVFGILINDHADSPVLVQVASNLLYTNRGKHRALKGLRQLIDQTQVAGTKAASYMSLAKLLSEDDATREEALGFYRLIVKEYPDHKSPRGETYGSMAAAALFEVEHLQVGMPVPDFASLDETGASFKVSDYKGKVVLLDFWGFW